MGVCVVRARAGVGQKRIAVDAGYEGVSGGGGGKAI